MGLTIDDNIIDLGYNGGDDSKLLGVGAKVAAIVLGIAFIVALVFLIMCKTEWMENGVYAAPGRASGQLAQAPSLMRSHGNYWASDINRTGVDCDQPGLCGLDNFTVNVGGKMYSDEKASPYYVAPDANGQYQYLNPNAPHYLPSTQDIMDAAMADKKNYQAGASNVSGVRYTLGRIDLSDCDVNRDIQYANGAWDWMKTQAESGSAGQLKKPAPEYFSSMKNDPSSMTMALQGY